MNKTAEELKNKVVLLSGAGAMESLNATVTEKDMLKDKTAYARGVMVTGTIETYKGEVIE